MSYQISRIFTKEDMDKLFSSMYEQMKSELCKGWHDWVKGMCYSVVDFLKISRSIALTVRDILGEIQEALLSYLDIVAMDAKASWDEGSMKRVYGDLTLFASLEFLLDALLDVLQTNVLGSSLNLKGIQDFLDKTFQSDEILGLVIRSQFSIGVFPYIKALINSKYLPYIPGVKETVSLYVQGYLSYIQFKSFMYANGVPDQYHQYFLDILSRTPSIGELVNFYQYTDVPEFWIREKLKINDVGNELEYWWKYIKGIALRDEYRRVETYLKQLYSEGYFTQEEILSILRKLKSRQEEMDILTRVWDKVRERNLYKYYLEKHIYLLRRKRIKCKDLEERIAGIIKDPLFRQAIAMRECAYLGYDYPTEDLVL